MTSFIRTIILVSLIALSFSGNALAYPGYHYSYYHHSYGYWRGGIFVAVAPPAYYPPYPAYYTYPPAYGPPPGYAYAAPPVVYAAPVFPVVGFRYHWH